MTLKKYIKNVFILFALSTLVTFTSCDNRSVDVDTEEINTNDLKIKIFHLDVVNTLVCYDDTKNGVIVDPGMTLKSEQTALLNFIKKENIVVKYIINTHPHGDHIVGNAFCVKNFNVPLVAHEAGLPLYNRAATGVDVSSCPTYDIKISDGDDLTFGNQTWKVLYTPGHANGSVCLYDEKNKVVIVGDVLFAGSIGRTDFPTGNSEQLMQSINEKLLPLGDDVIVIPGHGETTTIGNEKKNNPFL